MPFYHAVCRPGLLGPDQREAFANDVVDVHCGVTGAPRSFVHVMFTDANRPGVDNVSVMGTIRAGRVSDIGLRGLPT